jgi:hypothetical protein
MLHARRAATSELLPYVIVHAACAVAVCLSTGCVLHPAGDGGCCTAYQKSGFTDSAAGASAGIHACDVAEQLQLVLLLLMLRYDIGWQQLQLHHLLYSCWCCIGAACTGAAVD